MSATPPSPLPPFSPLRPVLTLSERPAGSDRRTGTAHPPASGRPDTAGGFTLVEVMVALVVASLFLFGAYQVFSGGSFAAQKAHWLQARTNELNNTFQVLGQRLKSTSFPSTLLPDGIFDASTGADRQEYFVAFKGILPPSAARDETSVKVSTLSGETVVGTWVVCEPERFDARGRITSPGALCVDRLLLVPNPPGGKVLTANLVLRCEAYDFTTSAANGYARGGINRKRANQRDKHSVLLSDVVSLRFESVTGPKPLPIVIGFETRWPKDDKVSKQMQNSIIPNAVGIKDL